MRKREDVEIRVSHLCKLRGALDVKADESAASQEDCTATPQLCVDEVIA